MAPSTRGRRAVTNKENEVPNKKKKKRGTGTALTKDAKKRRKTPPQPQKMILRPMPNTNDLEALPYPNAVELLGKISNDADRHLQVLLWEIDCHYVLFGHQFKGVRAMAGVPQDFPGLNPPPSKDEALMEWVVANLQTVPPSKDRGVLMADVMGLGKTVQSVAACMLRNALALVKGQPRKPTLIVSPNDAVLLQWQETLIKANVSPNAIFRFKAKTGQVPLKRHQFYLCNRYDLQTEARHIFTKLNTDKTDLLKSPLFPSATKSLLKCLTNQYNAEQGKTNNWFKAGKEIDEETGAAEDKLNTSEVVTKSLTKYVGKMETVYETVVIDEAHFLKNLAAYWGMAAGLLGLHANRIIPMTGTPYNNGCQDVASLMTFIDPRLASAKEKWWKQATRQTAAKSVQEAIQEWSNNYLIRRDKDVIAAQLPRKTIRKKSVGPLPLELSVYEVYEEKFLLVLKKFQQLERMKMNKFNRRKMKEYFELMLSFASCMRSSLIHPLLAGGGRDVTILFSPSRGKRQGMLSSQEKPFKCQCCGRNNRREKKKAKQQSEDLLGDFQDELEDDDDEVGSLKDFIADDDEILWQDDESEGEASGKKRSKPKAKHAKDSNDDDDEDVSEVDEKQKIVLERVGAGTDYGEGPMVAIPPSLCPLSEHGIRHFACETCLDRLQQECSTCPACSSAQTRLRLEHGRDELRKRKMEAQGKKASSLDDEDLGDSEMDIPRELYCKDIFGGFRASAKLESIIEDYLNLPKDDKVLVCSFFKGSLDLLEAIFYELGVETARFDGDIDSDERQMELDRFKEKQSCRVLLLTVQTGGTGLNLVNANHVWFVDRFWNPMVMEQAEDRCYRMGQTKDVSVVYHDVSYTIDDVMRHINEAKADNAKIILANGATLSTSTSGMSWKDVSGQLGNSVTAVRDARMLYVTANKQRIHEPLPPSQQGVLDSVNTGAATYSRYTSLVEAIAGMLGIAAPTAPSAGSSNDGIPMEINVDSKPAARPIQAKSEDGAIDSKAALALPKTKSKVGSSGAVGNTEAINLDTEEDSKPAAKPDQALSVSSNHASKPEAVKSEPLAKKAAQSKPKSILDDDSDDDSTLSVVVFKKPTKK